jgi:hypothetical protein
MSSNSVNIVHVILGGVMVIVLTTGPKFAGSNPAENVRFLRAIKSVNSTNSFGGEVKLSVQCRKIYGMLKIP